MRPHRPLSAPRWPPICGPAFVGRFGCLSRITLPSIACVVSVWRSRYASKASSSGGGGSSHSAASGPREPRSRCAPLSLSRNLCRTSLAAGQPPPPAAAGRRLPLPAAAGRPCGPAPAAAALPFHPALLLVLLAWNSGAGTCLSYPNTEWEGAGALSEIESSSDYDSAAGGQVPACACWHAALCKLCLCCLS